MFPYTKNQVWPVPPTQLYSYQTNQLPYQSINFLNQAFNYNKQSIAAYETLPHEMKLQFYLSVQQMKFFGYMQNKTRYQNILQEIARRKMILKKPDQNIQVKDNNDWGVKLDNILDGHLKKLQRDNFLDDIPVAINTSHQVQHRQVDFLSGEVEVTGLSGKKKSGQDDQQFEWAQSVDNSTAMNSQTSSKINQKVSGNRSQTYMQPISFEELIKKQNSINTKPQNIKIEAKAQIIDVWDLQMIQDQPKNTKILTQNPSNKTNSSTFPNSIGNNYSNYDQFEFQPQIKTEKFTQPMQENNIFNKSTPTFHNNYYNNQHNNFNQYKTNTNNNININRQNNNNSINTNYNHNIYENVQNNGQNISSSITNLNNIQNQHPNSLTSLVNNYKNSQIKINSVQNQQEQFQWQENTYDLANNQPQIAVVSINQPVSTPNIYKTQDITTVINVSEPQPQQQHFDFTFLQPQTNNTNISQSSSNIIGSSPSYSTQNIVSMPQISPAQKVPYESSINFGLDVSSIDSTFTFPTNARQQEVFNQSSINNSYPGGFLRKNTGEYNINQDQIQQTQQNLNKTAIIGKIDTNILQPLKRFPSTKKIVSMLNRKIFDFDRKFYQETLSLISQLGYQKNADYQFVKQQGEICDQIFRLTELYTAAVDQDKQDELKTTLKQSKILYTKLDTKKTATVAKKYLKLDGRTLNYEIGRLSLQAGVPGYLIKKIVAETKFNQIVTVLYFIEYLGNIFSIGTFGCQIIEYMERIIQQMQQIAYKASQMNPECVKMIKESQKFLQYRSNINKIAEIAKRILELAKICNKDPIHPRLPQILQKITPLLPPNSQSQQYLSANFLTFFSNFACREGNNIYTLHQKMNQFIQLNPLCTICLHPIQQKIGKQGQKNTDNKSYHYKCWNFRQSINKWKQEQIKKQNQQLNQDNQEIQQEIQQKNTLQN